MYIFFQHRDHGGQALCDEAVDIYNGVMTRIGQDHDPVPLRRLLLADEDPEVLAHITAESTKAPCPLESLCSVTK